MKRSSLILAIALALFAVPALGGQNLYVLNQGDDNVTVIDTWSGVVLGDFRVKSPARDLDAAHRSDFVVIAGKNDITWLHSANGYQRVDLQLVFGGNESVAIGLSPDDRYVYVAQTDPDNVFRVDLQHSDTLSCLERADGDCDLNSRAQLQLNTGVRDPVHMAVCDDGVVYLVGVTGEVSRHEPTSNGFSSLAIPAPRPADPRGIACTPDNGVVIMSGDRVLTEVLPGSSPVVNHYRNMPVADPGRIDVDPRRFGRDYQVLLTDRASGEIVRVENAALVERFALKGAAGQPLPWAVTAAANGMLGTANQGVDGATILYQWWAQLPRPTGARPIDADFGPVQGAAVEADPYNLEFVYGAGNSNSASQNMFLRSSGTSTLVIARVEIRGSADFSVKSDGCTGRSLAPGQTCSLSIGFSNPGTHGGPAYPNFNADLRVSHNGNPTAVNDFPLKAISFKQYIEQQIGSPAYAEEPFLK